MVLCKPNSFSSKISKFVVSSERHIRKSLWLFNGFLTGHPTATLIKLEPNIEVNYRPGELKSILIFLKIMSRLYSCFWSYRNMVYICIHSIWPPYSCFQPFLCTPGSAIPLVVPPSSLTGDGNRHGNHEEEPRLCGGNAFERTDDGCQCGCFQK